MRIFAALIIMLSAQFPTMAFGAAPSGVNEKYAVYYSDKAPLEKFKPYQFLVLDSSHHPALSPLKEDGKLLIGYVSLGEIDSNSSHFAQMKSKGIILMENKNWKGSYFVDMRDPMWSKIVLEELIPATLKQGFDGIFLDTLDNPLELEEQSPGRYTGMGDAAAKLVQAIRLHYPTIKVMMNRGYGLLPKVANSIDMELGESVYYDYNFDHKTYERVDAETYQEQLRILKSAQHDNPNLKVYTLDYAKPSDTSTIRDIYKTERANGFIPYVATVGLDQLVDEPKAE